MKRISLLLVFGVASQALAHDTWIAPDRFKGACGSVTLHMTSGMEFGKLDYAIDPSRVARAFVRVAGKRVNITPVAAAHSLDFRIDVPESGLAIVAVELAPKTLDLTPDKVAEYLDDIAATDAIRAEWKAHPGRWRESYTKHAKTFVRCSDRQHDFQIAADMGLELVPQGTDPTMLKAGDTLKIALIARSGNKDTLVRDVPIVLEREGTGRVTVVMPNAEGVASVVVPRSGRYMLTATRLRRSDRKDLDWVSDFTTITFGVE